MKKLNYKITLIATCIACLTLASCSGVSKHSLGFSKHSPNEYSVLRQQPLTVPPNFDLVEPQEGASQVSPSSEKEFDKIFHGENKSTSDSANPKVTQSDKAFLSKTKSHNKKTNIKKILTEENKQQVAEEKKEHKTLFEKMFGK